MSNDFGFFWQTSLKKPNQKNCNQALSLWKYYRGTCALTMQNRREMERTDVKQQTFCLFFEGKYRNADIQWGTVGGKN